MAETASQQVALPRVAFTYCTQCKWMLRAAYFGQELLSTFGTTIGEVALVPTTGGIFTATLTYVPEGPATKVKVEQGHQDVQAQTVLLWDRKSEGGFPGKFIQHLNITSPRCISCYISYSVMLFLCFVTLLAA